MLTGNKHKESFLANIKKRFLDLSLRKKVTGILSLLIIMIMIIIGCVFYQYYYRVLQKNIIETLEIAVTENVDKLKGLSDTIIAAINQVNDNDRAYYVESDKDLSPIADMVIEYGEEYNDTNLYELIQEMKMNAGLLKNIFSAASGSIQGQLSYALIIPRENPIARYFGLWHEDGSDGIFRSQGVESLEWYQRALENGGDIYWFCQENYPNRIFMSKELSYQKIDNAGQYSRCSLGVMLVSFDVSQIKENINTAELTKEMEIIILDQDNNVIYINQKDEEGFSEAQITNMIDYAVNQNGSVRYEYEKKDYLLQTNMMNDGLMTLSIIPFQYVQNRTFDMLKIILVIMTIILVLGMVFVAIICKITAKPILDLAITMQKGKLERVERYQQRNDEIGMLYRGYNQLQMQIQDLFQEVWEEADKKKRAQMHALQVQMNPHFIYNSLGAISCDALLNGQDQIADQLSSLSTIIRYNLKNPDALVTLREELSMVRRYEEIWKLSYEDSLIFNHNIQQEFDDLLIPKMILQPLVENAIIHGVDFTSGVGIVSISASLGANNQVLIMVTNNGRKADVEKINNYIHGKEQMDVDKERLGIKNVYERIKMLFEENGDLQYKLDEEGNTEAIISISNLR